MTAPPARVAVVTGTRAEFGLLTPIMHAIREHPDLRLCVIATGTHLLPTVNTIREIRELFCDAVVEVPMHDDAFEPDRLNDVRAIGRGIINLGEAWAHLQPDVVLVLGDRIEAFAGAVSASIGGRLLAHVHGGDRAEGVADESMRHAITKLAHLHFPATETSRERIIRMGEDPAFVFNVGSPAVDRIECLPPMSDEELKTIGITPDQPFVIILHHPTGLETAREVRMMSSILAAIEQHQQVPQFVLCAPNFDAGRDAILAAIGDRPMMGNLARAEWIALLRRASVIIGNSSAALIECAVLGIPAVNVGPRQNGRERAENVIDVPESEATALAIREAIDRAVRLTPPFIHPYGEGRCGRSIAESFARLRELAPSSRKLNTY